MAGTTLGTGVVAFLKSKGVEDESIEHMLTKCVRLNDARAMNKMSENWSFLEEEVMIPARKIPAMLHRCPQLLVMGVNEKLLPMVSCLRALGFKPNELISVISHFPHVLTHSVEEKLCPTLAFLQGIGVKEKNLTRVILRCPRLLSYSIERKLAPAISFLSSLGVGEKGIERIVTQCPHIMGYSIESRLRPTVQYLQGIGLSNEQLQNVASFFPHILCRQAERALRPAEVYLRGRGFSEQQVATLISGFPPILTKSIKHSLEPKMHFLVNVMGRSKDDVISFPAFFGYSLHRTIELRFRKIREQGMDISLSEMLGCNKRKFAFLIGVGDSSNASSAPVS